MFTLPNRALCPLAACTCICHSTSPQSEVLTWPQFYLTLHTQPQGPHSQILMTGEGGGGRSDRGSYFIPKKITTSKFVHPKKLLSFLTYPKKSFSLFFTTQKNPSVIFRDLKKSWCLSQTPKITFGQNFRPKKITRIPPSLKYVSGAPGHTTHPYLTSLCWILPTCKGNPHTLPYLNLLHMFPTKSYFHHFTPYLYPYPTPPLPTSHFHIPLELHLIFTLSHPTPPVTDSSLLGHIIFI